MNKKQPTQQANAAVFPISKVNALRNRAAKACPQPDNEPDGWSISSVDPMNLLGVFTALRMKPGFVLRAYQFRESGNGNGFVWAMPADAPFPEPSHCPRLTDRFLEPPKPPLSLDNLMDVVEGDGTPWSYLSSSLFERQAQEFGAMWHGCSWSTYTILGADPWPTGRTSKRRSGGMDGPSNDPDGWTWNESKPSEWRPSFEQVNDQITIRFLTYSGLGREAIYRNSDSFREGCYRFESEGVVIAEGRGGYVF
jgi:hypothetical protein